MWVTVRVLGVLSRILRNEKVRSGLIACRIGTEKLSIAKLRMAVCKAIGCNRQNTRKCLQTAPELYWIARGRYDEIYEASDEVKRTDGGEGGGRMDFLDGTAARILRRRRRLMPQLD